MSDDSENPGGAGAGKQKRRGLGRGLSALFGDDEDGAPVSGGEETSSAQGTGVASRRTVGVDLLEPGPFQPRKTIDMETIGELANSIAVHGVLQPLLVREKPGVVGRYEIIAGERRWRAAQKAQLHEVPVIVKVLDEEAAFEIALIENLQREDLNALEEALGFRKLMDDYGHTQEKLAAALGKSRSHIANMVRLLNLPASVQAMIREGKLSASHARALVASSDPEHLAHQVVSQGLSVRDTEKLAADASGRTKQTKGGNRTRAPGKDSDVVALENDMTAALGMRVSIDTKGHSGVVRVEFSNLNQLDDLVRRLSHVGADGRLQDGRLARN